MSAERVLAEALERALLDGRHWVGVDGETLEFHLLPPALDFLDALPDDMGLGDAVRSRVMSLLSPSPGGLELPGRPPAGWSPPAQSRAIPSLDAVSARGRQLLGEATARAKAEGLRAFDRSNAFLSIVSRVEKALKSALDIQRERLALSVLAAVEAMARSRLGMSPWEESGVDRDSLSRVFRLYDEGWSEAPLSILAGKDNVRQPSLPSESVLRVALWACGSGMPGAGAGPDLLRVVRNRTEALKGMGGLVSALLFIDRSHFARADADRVKALIDEGRPWASDLRRLFSLGRAEASVLARELRNFYAPGDACSALMECVQRGFPPERRAEFLKVVLRERASFARGEILPADTLLALRRHPAVTLKSGRPVGGWHSDLNDSLSALQDWVFAPAEEILEAREREMGSPRAEGGRHPPAPRLVAADAVFGGRSEGRVLEMLWKVHRELPALAALRQSHQHDLPPWLPLHEPVEATIGEWGQAILCRPPALVPEWRIECLTDAPALVMEGKALHHCVGGYHEQCLRGTSHVVAFRRMGEDGEWESRATMEILADPKAKGEADYKASLRVAQFRGRHNARVSDPETRAVAEAYLTALRNRPSRQGGLSVPSHEERRESLERIAAAMSASRERGREREAEMREQGFRAFWGILPDSQGRTLREWVERVVLPQWDARMGRKPERAVPSHRGRDKVAMPGHPSVP